MYLFEHKVLVPAALCGVDIPVYLNGLFLYDLSVDVIEGRLILFNAGYFHIVNVIHAAGVLQKRGHVGSEITALVRNAHNQRAVLSCNKNLTGVILEQNGDRVRTAHAQNETYHSFERVVPLVVVIVDQLCRDFGIRLRIELVPLRRELVL